MLFRLLFAVVFGVVVAVFVVGVAVGVVGVVVSVVVVLFLLKPRYEGTDYSMRKNMQNNTEDSSVSAQKAQGKEILPRHISRIWCCFVGGCVVVAVGVATGSCSCSCSTSSAFFLFSLPADM